MAAATAPTSSIRRPAPPRTEAPARRAPGPASANGSATAFDADETAALPATASAVAAGPIAAGPARAPSGTGTASPSERRAADAVGALMELWGFRRQLGRVWTLLFLSERPLSAPALRTRLGISSGLLSMNLAELRDWGVVRRVSIPGERKALWVAETDVWRLVRRVLAERERSALEQALAAFEAARDEARQALADADLRVSGAARFQAQRIARLAGLTRTALAILQAILRTARADLGPLRARSGALAVRRRAGGS